MNSGKWCVSLHDAERESRQVFEPHPGLLSLIICTMLSLVGFFKTMIYDM